MTSIARTIAPAELGLFTRAQALSSGITDNQLRKSGEYRRVVHGVYCSSAVEITHSLRCHAAALVLPSSSIITGRSAATLYGVPLARAHDRVEVLVSGSKYVNRRFGLRCWSVKSWAFERVEWAGIHLATIERTMLDLLARNPQRTAVAAGDALIHAGLADRQMISEFLAGRHDHGIVRARNAAALLDGRAESIPESELRVALLQAGFRFTPQFEIHDDFGFVARVDLALEEAKIALEYDGAWHADPARHALDQERLRRIRRCGWHVIIVTAERLYQRLPELVAEVGAAVAARRR
ncbi:DUF559 domain-containing protein [Saccharopolyspora indica]|uniref:DUF559 domain-containing protein n=1 Tax=Saccharopolyspora indica TaxID=1229659 RepID=UPI0022EAA3BC|nr:DUF559 domain-containing protein [Saccharopolyspora indica]MDA3649037.1 DUF559 domain-containing protein [Saccharopolyspora indica]